VIESVAPNAVDRLSVGIEQRMRPVIEGARTPRALRLLAIASAGALVGLFAFGAVMLATMLRWGYVAAGLLVLAALPPLVSSLAPRTRVLHDIVVTPVAILVPVIGLLGADVLWAAAGLPRPAPALGLVLAGAVVTGLAYCYLRWVGKPPPPHHQRWALFAGIAGLGLAALTGQDAPELKLILVAAAVGVATLLYLRRTVGHDLKHPLWWALLLVGFTIVVAPLLAEAIQGGRTSPTLLIAGALIAAIAGFNGLWLPREERLTHFKRGLGYALVFLVAIPLAVVAFIQITSVVPAAPDERAVVAAAAAAPLPAAAVAHRPILLFDGGERFRTPLDVDRMLASGDVELCPEGNGLLADCHTVNGPGDLRNGFGNLRFDTQQIADAQLPTTIYAHVADDALHPGWRDIDYWWYLPDNPANTAQGAMCGAGLVIPEITCFDHQSDWEGVTVVVDEQRKPVAVHYAAHNHVVDVPWTALQASVAGPRLRRYTEGRDVANRPLVFVARGTHAAYPVPCTTSTCNGDSAFEDNRHDGAHAWPEDPCSASGCVTGFPTAAAGSPASWNAFDGHWGSAVCVARVYCARSSAPRAPGTQGRFKRPWCYDFATGSDPGRAHPENPCRQGK